ncbi:MAG TPA: polysaccharide deacetylase family protein [Kofleriaceae bacterium]|nr:polysaccharide deacetylase family protein [Kofleriaceae bacterium]
MLLAGCQDVISDIDSVYYDGDGRRVHCAVSIDDAANNSDASVIGALDRAVRLAQIVELYGHRPGDTVSLARLEMLLEQAHARGLPFYTYAQLARGEASGAGVALSLDDTSIAEWHATLPLFAHYDATVTFFISRYARMFESERAMLVDIAAAGHDLEAHSVNHLRGPDYVEQHGLQAYLEDEVLPSIAVMEQDGYPVSAFAYPFGARTSETDRAILAHVPIVRSVAFSLTTPVQDACPE